MKLWIFNRIVQIIWSIFCSWLIYLVVFNVGDMLLLYAFIGIIFIGMFLAWLDVWEKLYNRLEK